MTQLPNGRTEEEADESILVAVRDEGEVSRGQASLIDNVLKAERIVAGLIEAGVAPDEVSALRAREISLRVSYRWVVELVDREDAERDETPVAPSNAEGSSSGGRGGLLTKAAQILEEVTPYRPFQLRLDRVLWLGLWAFSLLILGVSVLTSLTQGSAREFVIEKPAPFEGDLQTPAPPQNLVPEREQPSPVVAGATSMSACARGGSNECRCQDFKTQPEAQRFYEAYPPDPGHNVDPNGDGVVCEWLPGSPGVSEQ